MRIWLAVLAIVFFAVGMVWASDAITLQGERTVYTVDCRQGSWQGASCSGTLVAGPRYRFRTQRSHGEVSFWIVGATDEAAGKFTACKIDDGRNWRCAPCADSTRTITLQMSRGTPVPDASGSVRPFHAVAKWRWWLARAGVPVGRRADN